MKNNFVAIDFETSFGHIPCSIGIVEFVNGEIRSEYYSLIRPIDLKFNPYNSKINGIYLEDVFEEREFCDIWPEIEHFFNDRVIVAHNISTDINVLEKTLDYYRIHKPNYTVYCTLEMSRCLIELNNHKLSTLATHFRIPQNNYHNALEDAYVCGKLFFELIDKYNQSESYEKLKPISYSTKVTISKRIVLSPFLSISSSVFNGKKIVISGVFYNFSREELIQIITNNCGTIVSSISSKTDYVVAGANMGPSKLEKATKLGITILSEEEFIAMIS
jgi:DNA polymerase III subunit epsilon